MARCSIGIPRLYAAASLKRRLRCAAGRPQLRIPRLYAAASLKRAVMVYYSISSGWYSAALCRGLIEASTRWPPTALATTPKYSAALCRGLIEASGRKAPVHPRVGVFRGSMPRPH